MRRIVVAVALAFGLSGGAAKADHYMATADPFVVGMINQIVGMYSQACQVGSPMGCQLAEMAMSEGHALLNAGWECQFNGNQQACWYYQQTVQQTQASIAQMQQAQLGGGNPLGATHAERMQSIHNWGQSRLAWGQQQSAIMDQRHEQFMQSLRN